MSEKRDDYGKVKIKLAFKDAWTCFRSKWFFFVLIGILMNLPVFWQELIYLKGQSSYLYFDALFLKFLHSAFYAVGSFFIIRSALEFFSAQRPDLQNSTSRIKVSLWRFVLVVAYCAVLTKLGFMLFLIPGIYCFLAFSLTPVIVLRSGGDLFFIFKRSERIVRKNFWKIFVLIVGLFTLGSASGLLFRFLPDLPSFFFSSLWMVLFSLTYSLIITAIYYRVNAAEDLPVREVSRKKQNRGFGFASVIFLLCLFVAEQFFPLVPRSLFRTKATSEKASSYFAQDKTDVFDLTKPKEYQKEGFILYIPTALKQEREYPLLVALSPSKDLESLIKVWQNIAEEQKEIVCAIEEGPEDSTLYDEARNAMSIVNEIVDVFPADKSKIIVSGFSSGGMVAHAFANYYPKSVLGIIVNTGMIDASFLDDKNYIRNKLAVLLASPTDFRYEEMQRDRAFLEKNGWDINWIEFKGGHVIAPSALYAEAIKWIFSQVGGVEVTQEETPQKKQDVPDGVMKEYDQEGNLSGEIAYKNGKRNGISKAYYRNGTLWSVAEYKKGKKDGRMIIYNEDGSVQTEAQYKAGKKDGLFKAYYANQKLWSSTEYKNGEKDGWVIVYNEDRSPQSKVHYENGKLQGEYIYYEPKGKIAAIEEYDQGEKVSRTGFDNRGNKLYKVYYENGQIYNEEEIALRKLLDKVRNFFKK